MKRITNKLYILIIVVVLTSCKAVDIRTDYLLSRSNGSTEAQGRELLAKAVDVMGYDKLEKTRSYEVTAQFNWKGAWLLLPMNALPGNNNNDIQFRFATNTFDGQVEFLEGRKDDKIFGIQSWQGYKVDPKTNEVKEKNRARHDWGLATYHYLLEAPFRLLNECEIIRYAGEKTVEGTTYSTVYATWGTEAPNKEYDRWLLYINQQTGFVDLLEVTINDFFLPMPKGMQHATVYVERSKTSIGTYMPNNVIIQLKSPKRKEKKVYSFALRNYKFDSFPKEQLYPLEGLKFYGNSKPESK